jgi:hypothetical protein
MVLLLLLLSLPAFAEKPVIEAVSPTELRAGGADFILRVRGRGFGPMSVARWNGAERVTAVLAPDLLSAMIPASDLAQAGKARLSVRDPERGLSKTFEVSVLPGSGGASGASRAPNPVPEVTAFSPSHAKAGAAGLTLTVRGQGFTPFSVVRLRGAPRPTRYLGPTTLVAKLHAGDLAKAGQAAVSVRNPFPGGGLSAPRLFAVGAAPGSGIERPRVYPNPWREGQHDGDNIAFENLALRSMIKIFTVSGSFIKTIAAGEGSGEWDLTDSAGRVVNPGAYVYLITDGKKTVEGKLKITR